MMCLKWLTPHVGDSFTGSGSAVWLTTTLIFIIDPDWKIESKQHMSHIYSFWSIWCCILSDELLTALDWMFRFIWLGEEMGLNWWIGFTSHVKVHVVKGCLAKIINRQNCAKSNKFSFNLPLFCSCELSTLTLCKKEIFKICQQVKWHHHRPDHDLRRWNRKGM